MNVVYYINLWPGTIVINILSHYDDELHQQLILSVGFVIVIKFCFTCGDYIDSLFYYHSQLRDTRVLLLPISLVDKIVKYSQNTIKIALSLDIILCLALDLIQVQAIRGLKNYNDRQELFKTDSKTKEKCDIKMVKYSA